MKIRTRKSLRTVLQLALSWSTLVLTLGCPFTARAAEPDVTWHLPDGSGCAVYSMRAPYVNVASCELVNAAYGTKPCDTNPPNTFHADVADFGGGVITYYDCGSHGYGGVAVGLGYRDVQEPVVCQVIGDANDSGVQCVNVYYGSGLALKHTASKVFQPHQVYGGLELATCIDGYVWREARTTYLDHLCVTPATRDRTRQENAAAAANWQQGPYGPHTCKQGLVWRQAYVGDDVCVTPASRDQARSDFAAAESRRQIHVAALI